MKKRVVFALMLVFFISFISADFELGNASHSFDTEYAPSGTLRGWVNISFDSESLDSYFEDSFNNEITLQNLLAQNPSYDADCSTTSCVADYVSYNPTDNLRFTLNENESITFGMVLTQNIQNIESISFKIVSNASESCKNQLKIDFLSDGNYEIGNNKSTESACTDIGKNYSCYNQSLDTNIAYITSTPYCQRFWFSEAPGFRLGSWVKMAEDVEDQPDLIMRIFNGSNVLAECELTDLVNTVGEEISCDIDFLVNKPKEYMVCIFSPDSTGEEYHTKLNTNAAEKCGQPSISGNPTTAFHLFVEPLTFGAIGELSIPNYIENYGNLSDKFEDYIHSVYGNLNCSGKCILPIKLTSQQVQDIRLYNLKIRFKTDAAIQETNNFYQLNKSSATVSSNFQKLYFDNAGFDLPSSFKSYNYKLYLNSELLVIDNITIGKFPEITWIKPGSTALGYETVIKAEAKSESGNITKYEWDIDGAKITTTIPETKFTFNSLGKHNITLTVTDSTNKKISKNFHINVVTPGDKIDSDLARLKNNINFLEDQVTDFQNFEREVIEEILDLENAKKVLEEVENKSKNATTEADFLYLLDKLFSVDVPESISVSDNGESIIFFPQEKNIYLEVLANVTGEDYNINKEDDYIKAILSWDQKNMDVKVSYKDISSTTNSVQSHMVGIYKIQTVKKTELDSNPHIFINKMENFKFRQNYDEESYRSFYYIELLENQDAFEFSTTEKINFLDLPVFVAPEISKLNLRIETYCDSDEDCEGDETCNEYGVCQVLGTSKWTIFYLAIILLLLAAIIVYIILAQWYKNKYETHLFKNRNNLFNLVSYINHQKKKGLNDSEIEKKLQKANWNTEQITYAMKKYYGKNTGMWMLPFSNLFGKKKDPTNPYPRGHFGVGSGGINYSQNRFPPR